MALGEVVSKETAAMDAGPAAPGQLPGLPSPPSSPLLLEEGDGIEGRPPSLDASDIGAATGGAAAAHDVDVVYLPHRFYLGDLRHDAGEPSTSSAATADAGAVSRWRMKDRMKTGCVALVLCLNIGVDPPDVIKISPCARMECWIDPYSMTSPKALDAIGKSLQAQYERWQPRARYKLQLDPTVEEVKKLCQHCRKGAKSERVLFHYNGHGVPKPTNNGEIWLFNKSFTQYIPLSVYELESWLQTPSIYVFDCSAAGMIVNAFCERPEWGPGGGSSMAGMRDCILLAACGANEILPQNKEFPADIFTSCLTTPIKIALRWFCPRSLLKDSLDPDLIDKIPGRQNDRKTPLGELNWIFTAITDTIAWNVLPRELFQRLFRQDLLVASLFRNFLLAERIMRSANCSPVSYPHLPPTHQHPMWHSWDMAAEVCLSQLHGLLNDPAAEFQPSRFFTEQLTAFEVWLEHGSERKKQPEQLPIVLQVLLSQSHRYRALVLLGRFLDMGAWAVDQALSVGIFPYVLKLLQTTATELRQILVFIWTKILALDKVISFAAQATSKLVSANGNYLMESAGTLKSCQVDLVKDNGHNYFIKFLDSPDIYPEQRSMAAFVLAVVADNHFRGQQVCVQGGMIPICLSYIQSAPNNVDGQAEPLLLQWLCLCLAKIWDGNTEGVQAIAINHNAAAVLSQLLSDLQPEVRASATYALGTLISAVREPSPPETGTIEEDDDEGQAFERDIAIRLLKVLHDGSPLVRAELAIALARLALSHNSMYRSAAAAYLKPPSNSILSIPLSFSSSRGKIVSHQLYFHGRPPSAYSYSAFDTGSLTARIAYEGNTPPRAVRVVSGTTSLPASIQGSPSDTFHGEESRALSNGTSINGFGKSLKGLKSEDGGAYVQCVAAGYALARDPAPKVASLGRHVLRILGVEAVVLKPVRASTGPGHARTTSMGAIPPTPPMPSALTRSTSWVASSSGNLVSTWRTPPPSPPRASSAFLAGSVGMRRVSSLEFSPGPPPTTPLENARLPLRISGELGILTPSPVRKSMSVAGLAEAGSILAAGISSLSYVEGGLPQSTLYSWSCGHFARPLLDPGQEDEEEIFARREERERIAFDGLAKCQHASVSKVSDQIASCDTLPEGSKAVLMHPFMPVVCIADEKEKLWLWNYEEGEIVNSFENHYAPDKGVSRLCMLNELDDSLLLVASADGSVRVWKDYMQKDKQRLATAWQAVQGHRPGARSINAVVDWQQSSGYLYASGEISSIMVWELQREMLATSINSDGSTSAMAASQVHSDLLAAGCVDGSIRVFDMRMRQMLVCAMKPCSERVLGIDFQPGMEAGKLVCSSQYGDLNFIDMRNTSRPYLSVEAHKGHLTAQAVHRHAPVIATGSAKQFIKVYSMSGEQLSIVRYHNSFLGQRIGPVSCLNFHPYNVLLAAGALDTTVSVYADSR